MNVLQEVVLPKRDGNMPECLYYKYNTGVLYSDNKLKLIESENYPIILTFDTFFGAFPIEAWYKYSDVEKVILYLKAKGKFILNLKVDNGYEPEQKIDSLFYDNPELETIEVEINLNQLPFQKGILFTEFFILDEGFEIEEMNYVTSKKPNKEVKLAIIMPTYKREKYVKRNIDLLQKSLFSDKSYKVDLFVIDNGNTLDDVKTPNIKVIKNPNYGGAGGFARGLLEILDKDYTHVLFSDDDILYEPESIKRLFNFYKYSNKDNIVIGGGMFNLNTKHILNEHGAYLEYMNLIIMKHNLNICERYSIINYTYQEKINYYAWWFFSCSKKIFENEGLPLPIFFRGDDQEFGMRIKERVEFIPLLGVGVWHEEFYKKDMPLTDYYIIRNNLILSMIHEKKSFTLIKNLFRRLMGALLTYRYERAKFIVKGIEDFLKGHTFIENLEADKYHQQLLKEQKKKPKDMSNEFVQYKYNIPVKKSFLKNLLIFLTLNGHLMPKFLVKKGTNPHDTGYVIEHLHSHRLESIFLKETVLYYEPTTGMGIKYSFNRKKFFSLLMKGIFYIAKVYFKYSFLKKDYINRFKYLTSKEFWEKHLNVK